MADVDEVLTEPDIAAAETCGADPAVWEGVYSPESPARIDPSVELALGIG